MSASCTSMWPASARAISVDVSLVRMYGFCGPICAFSGSRKKSCVSVLEYHTWYAGRSTGHRPAQ